ncbi:MAG: alkaline phosphatase family protein [Planctomycetaceae bacterium]
MLRRLLLCLVMLPVTAVEAALPRTDHCVVLISVDGLAGFYFDDPHANLPTLRKLAGEGARAEGLTCSFPTVTWPNHTTLVTGVAPVKHGVIGNNYFDRTKDEKIGLIVDPVFDKDQLVTAPTIYDAAHEAGLTTAGIVWPATRNARSLDFTVPDMGGDNWNTYGTQGWLEELRKEGLPVDQHGKWCKEPTGGPMRDWLYARLANQLFQKHPPNLLLVHLIEVDHAQHKHGPRSPEAYWAVNYADHCVRDIVDAANQSQFQGKVTFVIASDHGFLPIETDIRPNVKLTQLGLLKLDGSDKKSKQAWCVAQGGSCMVYVLDQEHQAEIVAQLAKELGSLPGVDRVILPDQYGEIGQSTPDKDPRAPDLWLAAKSGYSFTDTHTGDEVVGPRETKGGTHGYLPNQPELYGTLILNGADIKPGGKFGVVSNQDVAPTIARLLGLELPTADGRVLTEALRE